MVRSSGTLVTVPRSCSRPISARICSLTRANSGSPTYFLPFSFSTVCAMSRTILLTVFTVNSICRLTVITYMRMLGMKYYGKSAARLPYAIDYHTVQTSNWRDSCWGAAGDAARGDECGGVGEAGERRGEGLSGVWGRWNHHREYARRAIPQGRGGPGDQGGDGDHRQRSEN